MNAISVSVKTNTVLVCKDLAEAQFRCLECSKAFISDRHLAKHNRKRHGIAQYLFTPIEQTDVSNENETKLAEVTGRLEKALSLLEAKASSLDSTASLSKPTTVRESGVVNVQHSPMQEPPQSMFDVRKTVSLFTLPNYGVKSKLDALCGDILSVPELNSENFENERPTEKLMSNDEDEKTARWEEPRRSGGSPEHELIPAESKQTDVESQNGPPEIPGCSSQAIVVCDENQLQPNKIEPLLIDLIKKLDTVFSGNRQLANSCCQTRLDTADNLSASGRKSVRFSDSPLYYGTSEQHFNQSESDCSSSGKSGEGRGRFDDNDAFQTYTNYSAQSQMTRPVYHPESAGVTRIVCDAESADMTRDLEYETTRIQSDQDAASEDSYDSSVGKPEDEPDSRNRENCTKTSQCQTQKRVESEMNFWGGSGKESQNSAQIHAAAVKKAVAPPPTPVSAAQPSPGSATPERNNPPSPDVRRSAEFFATKKQILEIVEKCVKDIKDKRTGSKTCEKPQDQRVVGDKGNPVSPGDQLMMNQEPADSHFKSANVICVGMENITADSQGISPPCTMICKDEEADIDDLSGDSYERFMKRFYCRVTSPPQGKIEPSKQSGASENANKDNLNSPPSDGERLKGQEDREVSTQPNSGFPVVGPQGKTKAGPTKPSAKPSDLRKAEYAVLLHDETSQVQSLIDTLVTDLHRWRTARRDHLSHAVRLQLEERLTSSLNLLGIQSNATLLSDSAAATAHFLLKNRQAKFSKVSPSSYFDVVKYAFVNEVDRIAKSRMKDHTHSPATYVKDLKI